MLQHASLRKKERKKYIIYYYVFTHHHYTQRTSACALSSVDTTNYILPRLHTKFRERAFSYACPQGWNALPENTRRETRLVPTASSVNS